jgi:apolipoprotein N-acyltransferase
VNLPIRGTEWRRLALAAGGGLLLACAFPKLEFAGLAWIAPGVIVGSALGSKGGTAFRAGYVAGFAFHLAALYWLLLIPVRFAPIVGWIALSAFLALYPAFWAWLLWRIYPADFETAEPGVNGLLDRFNSSNWRQRAWWCLIAAAAWVAWEMAQARVLSGFPWNFLGASQYRMLPLLQISSFTGVYGVTFLIVWFSAALLCAVARMVRQPAPSRGALFRSGTLRSANGAWSLDLAAPALVIAAVIGSGMLRLRDLPVRHSQAGTLRVALIQPSIPQVVIWNPSVEEKARRFAELVALSEAALTNSYGGSPPALLVWPEAALPDLLRWSTNEYAGKTIFDAVTDLARRHNVWMVIGADDAELKRSTQEVLYYNSSFLISPAGELVDVYRKRRLVIFGEYVPLSEWLPFLKTFTQVHGEFTPGDKVVTFGLPDVNVQTSVLICFEDVFPHITREHVKRDTDFLLNLTNNGWFGESAAQWQHAANAVFRAIENGVPLVRCANNGLTCWVDITGALHDIYFPGSTDIYKAGYKIADVPVPTGRDEWRSTFYREHGDWFGWTCVLITVGVLLRSFFRPVGAEVTRL